MSDESSDNNHAWWMPADQPDPAEHEDLLAGPGWPQPDRPIGPLGLHAGSRRPYVIAGVAVAALLGGAGAAVAATHSTTPAAASSAVVTNPTPTPGQPGATLPKFPRFRPGLGLGPGLGFGLFGAVHGQFVIRKSGGGYQTIDVQTGQVTAVSSTSITLKSSDGFTNTYVITSSTLVDAQRDGIGSVKAGNQATVLATVNGSTATAARIMDRTLMQQTWPGSGYPPGSGSQPGSAGGPGAQPG